MGNGQWAMGNGQWAMGNGQWAMGNKISQGRKFLKLNIVSAKNVKETTVYKKAFALAMQIFEISKKFPPEEKYSLKDQIRRSSRSV